MTNSIVWDLEKKIGKWKGHFCYEVHEKKSSIRKIVSINVSVIYYLIIGDELFEIFHVTVILGDALN